MSTLLRRAAMLADTFSKQGNRHTIARPVLQPILAFYARAASRNLTTMATPYMSPSPLAIAAAVIVATSRPGPVLSIVLFTVRIILHKLLLMARHRYPQDLHRRFWIQ